MTATALGAMLSAGLATKMDVDEILKTPPRHHAEIRKQGGAMTLFIDGEPSSGQMWSHICYHNVSDHQLVAHLQGLSYPLAAIPFAVGENRLTALYPTSWTGPREYDWSYIDTQARRVLQARPDARLILMLAFDGAKWWTDANPEAANPEVDRDPEPRKPGPKGIPDYLSPVWKATAREVLRELVAHVQSSDWGGAVVGYELYNGSSMDCNFRVPNDNARVREDLRRFLKARYGSDAKLQEAWGDPSVTLDTATPATEVPSGLILEPIRNRRFLDTRELLSGQFREVFSDFAAIIKEATQGRAIVGARTGDFLGNYGWNHKWFLPGEDSGWLPPLLVDANFDYFDVQEPYPGRALGRGAGVPVLPARGLLEHGKAIWIQNDVRTHLSKPGIGYGRTPDLASTVQLQRRVFANSLTYGMNPYLWQMDYHYNDPTLFAEYQRQEAILQEAIRKDRASVAEVAFVFDPKMRQFLGHDREYTDPSRYFALFDFPKHVWQRAGVPFDMIFLDQIETLPPYKVYVFCHTWHFTPEAREVLKKVVFQKGRCAVFLWADGVIDEKGAFSAAAMSDLTGLPIVLDTDKSPTWRMKATGELADMVDIREGSEVGTLPLANYDDAAKEAGDWVYPLSFRVEAAEGVIPLAIDREGRIGAALRRGDGYSVIYTRSGNVTEALLRLANREAGVFEYTGSRGLLMANRSYLAYHADKAETLVLKTPEGDGLRNLFSDEVLPPAAEHRIQVGEHSTTVFERVPASEAK